ncbi:Phosphate transporter [Quillaja saponaria]|uniref:Phosphate transporter n=1 Tax=Quillaja saponaria TaxID=32244 RepID=A0AAD7Q9B1_QUISA|nr:Phosphate transporter [Quillaja saponaria]
MAKEQLRVLNALDAAKTQWYHFTAIIIAGMGFFTDAYDLFCISLVTKLLGRIYYHAEGSAKPGSLPPNVSAAVNGVALSGTLAGQLFFGWLGDKLGRKKVYGMTLMIMVLCSIGSGLSFGHNAKSVMATLCFFRFWLGFGIGGDYPLSATIMSEYANKKTRASVFKAKFNVPAYEVDPIGSTVPEADYVWRIILMVGAIPAALTYYWRLKMPETARYTALVAKNAEQAASDMSKVLQVDIEAEPQKIEKLIAEPANAFGFLSKEFLRRHGLHLLGTTSTWFLLDIAFYSQNLFQKDIFTAIGWIPAAKTMNAIEEVFRIARAQTLIALCSTVPGSPHRVCHTVFTDILLCKFWTETRPHLSCQLRFSLQGSGLLATGISAAAGKLGAMVGAFGFLYLAQNQDKTKTDAGFPPGIGVKNSLIVLGVINFLGMVCTFLVPESKGKSLEEMSGETEDT